MSPAKVSRRVALLAATLVMSVTVLPMAAGAQLSKHAQNAAKASAYPAPTLNPTNVTAGSSTTVSGSQCDPSSGPTTVFVSLVDSSGNVLASTSSPPNPDGTWQIQLTVPSNASTGTYGVYSTCDTYYSEFYYPSASLTVTAAGASPWSIQTTVNKQAPSGTVTGVSCTSSTSCIAVGTYLNAAGQTAPLAETLSGTTWSAAAMAAPAGATQYGVNGVVCTSATSCEAVGNMVNSTGHQVTLAESFNGTKWTAQSPPNPTGGSSDVLEAVSCASATACTAVGSYNSYVNGQLESQGLVERWSGTSWTLQTLSSPSSNAPFGLTSVSCATSTSCTAVGWYSYSWQAFAATWSGSSWATTSVSPPSGGYEPSLSSVSCNSATACTAVGSYYDPTYGGMPLVERLSGSTWAAMNTSFAAGAYASLDSVSCASASACTAAGSYYGASGVQPLAVSGNGSSWSMLGAPEPASSSYAILSSLSCPTATTCTATGSYVPATSASGVPLPMADLLVGAGTLETVPTLNGASFSELESVSCSAAAACTAVGSADSSSGAAVSLAERWNGTSWANQTVPAPAGSTGAWLNGVACPLATSCVAVGGSVGTQDKALSETWNGTAWSIKSVPVPAGTLDSGLDAVSCSSATACTAVGAYVSPSSFQNLLLAERWNGTSWKATTLPEPADVGYNAQLNSVSCGSATSCVAVGTYLTETDVAEPLIETWNGASWSAEGLTNLPGGWAELDSVSCTAATTCVAVGANYSLDTPVAESLSGTTWTVLAPASGGTGGSLFGVSCTAATTCTAVGWVSGYGYPHSGPVAETWDGTTWAQQPMPKVPNQAAAALGSVSCVSAGVCASVGSRSLGTDTTLAEGEGGA